jgi:hypothetical protein
MAELKARWSWGDNDLRDVFSNCELTPSYFIKGDLWEWRLNNDSERRRFRNTGIEELMYLVNHQETGVLDGYFDMCSRARIKPDLHSEEVYFELTGVASINNGTGIPFSEVILHGVVMLSEIERFESLTVKPATQFALEERPAATQWWNSEYDIWELAVTTEDAGVSKGFGFNERGRRAGRYPLRRLSDAIAAHIELTEKADGTNRAIGAKTIENFLKSKGWD